MRTKEKTQKQNQSLVERKTSKARFRKIKEGINKSKEGKNRKNKS